jgi:hypothetical protein
MLHLYYMKPLLMGVFLAFCFYKIKDSITRPNGFVSRCSRVVLVVANFQDNRYVYVIRNIKKPPNFFGFGGIVRFEPQ